MKKLIAIILTSVLLLSMLIGCAANDPIREDFYTTNIVNSGDITTNSLTVTGGMTGEVFVPVYYAGATATMESAGVLIDSVAEKGAAALLVPQNFTTIIAIELILLPQASENNMYVDIITYYGAYDGEAHNTHGETADARDIGTTTSAQNLAHDISDLIDEGTLAAGDLLSVVLSYDGPVASTNLIYRGIRLRYN